MENEFYKNRIQEELTLRCERNPRYSLRAFAKALGIDAGAVSRILSGKLVPSVKVAEKLVEKLDLSSSEQRQFLVSVGAAHRARNSHRVDPIFRKLESQSVQVKELSAEIFRVIADWYHYAILELTFTPGFKSDPQWIAAELGISPLQAKLAIERLLKLSLLERNKETFRKADQKISTGEKHLTTTAHRNRQKQVLEKAIFSLENDAIESRSNTAMTMAIDPTMLPLAKEKILKFNQELCELLESGKRTQVYELSISLFPIQKRRKNS